MTLPIERARSRKPVTWLTLIGVLLLPAVIGGILVAALFNPTARLDSMNAAIVNNDHAVTLNDQLVPLGRQLTAGLVKGSPDAESNLNWTISNTSDAAKGLKDGTYDAVITIPKNFSAAATSTAPGNTPERATIGVETAPDSLIVDDAITSQVTQAAASLMGEQLSTLYLKNVFMGFTTLSDKLGDAANGAESLASGATKATSGAESLAEGVQKLSAGAGALATGADGIAAGAGGVASGAGQLATGATGVAGGASSLASGAHQLAGGSHGVAQGATKVAEGAAGLGNGITQLQGGLDSWAGGAQKASKGLTAWAGGAETIAGSSVKLADGLDKMAAEVAKIPTVPKEVIDGLDQVAANSESIKAQVTASAARLQDLSDTCAANGGSAQLCGAIADAAKQATAALPTVTGVISQSGVIADQVKQLSGVGPELTAGLTKSAEGARGLSGGITDLAAGASKSAAGVGRLATGAGALADGAGALGDGADSLAGGARSLASGATRVATGVDALGGGAAQLATGADKLAGGVGSLAGGAAKLSTGAGTFASGAQSFATGASDAGTGAEGLASGIGKLADGTASLADGLGTAASSLPSYTSSQAKDLASVVADPVTAKGAGSALFGASAVPLLAALALWFGGLASFIALQAVPRNALSSRRASARLALRNLAPAAGVGAAQGILVAGVVQTVASYEWSTWWAFALLCVVAGVSFAAVNQMLVAVFGGMGRWISALVGVLAVATGIVSTIPGIMASIAGLMPTMPAYQALLGSLTSAGGVGAGLAGMIIWALIAFIVTVIAVARRRTTSAGANVKASAVAA